MALFQVPGWTVPATPVSAQTTSKKRKRRASHSPDDLQSAQANLERLVSMLGDTPGDSRPSKKPSVKAKFDKNNSDQVRSQAGKKGPSTPNPPKGKKNEQKQSKGSGPVTTSGSTSKPSRTNQGDSGLTPMQKSMKESLGGARFRCEFP